MCGVRGVAVHVSMVFVRGVRVCVRMCVRACRYWDRYDEGIFVGGPNQGSALHVDQVPTTCLPILS